MKKLALLVSFAFAFCFQSYAFGPDFMISWAYVTPNPVTPSTQTIDLNYTCKNIGYSDSWVEIDIWLSADLTIDGSDVKVTTVTTSTIPDGGSYSGSVTNISMSSYSSSGPYYLIMKVDPNDHESEGTDGENNNIYSVTVIPVSAGNGSDLTVHEATIQNNGFKTGDSIDVTVSLRNTSSIGAPASTAGVFISTSRQWDNANVTYLGEVNAGIIPSHDMSPVLYQRVKTPEGLNRGVFYMHFVADFSRTINESDEYNNILTVPVTVYDADPNTMQDQELISVELDRDSFKENDTLSFDVTIGNPGKIKSDSVKVSVMFAFDPIYPGGTTIDYMLPRVDTSATYSCKLQISVPDFATFPPYMIFFVDYDNLTQEPNELNNKIVKTVTLLDNPKPNLYVSHLSCEDFVTQGTSTPISVTIDNGGSGDAAATVLKLYGSINDVLDGSDVLLATINVPAIAAGNFETISQDINIPSTLSTDISHLIAKADGNNTLWELDETDNVREEFMFVEPANEGSITVTSNTSGQGSWQIVGFPNVFNYSVTVTGVPPGSQTLTFSAVSGYKKPANKTINVIAGQTTQVNVNYELNSALEEVRFTAIKAAYPNPTQGLFIIEFNASSKSCVAEIMDLTGKQVMNQSAANTAQMSLDITSLPDGIYFARVVTDEQTAMVKIVKE